MTKNKYIPRRMLNFQSKALNFLKNKDYGAIFYEQGLGKTKIAIDLLLTWIDQKLLIEFL